MKSNESNSPDEEIQNRKKLHSLLLVYCREEEKSERHRRAQKLKSDILILWRNNGKEIKWGFGSTVMGYWFSLWRLRREKTKKSQTKINETYMMRRTKVTLKSSTSSSLSHLCLDFFFLLPTCEEIRREKGADSAGTQIRSPKQIVAKVLFNIYL